jgi:lysophospholipase L1-like esterase
VIERDPQAMISRALLGPASARRPSRPRCYVAMGDSLTAGEGCAERERWPDLLATSLRRLRPGLRYENLAVTGATSAEVAAQLPRALELEPDLVTVLCGGNDVLYSLRPDIDGYRENLRSIFVGLRATLPSVVLVTATCPDAWRFLDLRPRTRARVESAGIELNRATRSLAATYGAVCLEVSEHPGLEEPENFSEDGLHPSALGHARMAGEVSRLLWPHDGPTNVPEEGAA